MLSYPLGQTKSLRQESPGLGSVHGKIRHLGTKRAPNKRTLAHAKPKWNPNGFEKTFYRLYASILPKTKHCPYKPKKKGRTFRFKNKLLSLEASIITLVTRPSTGAITIAPRVASSLISSCISILDHDGPLSPWDSCICQSRSISPANPWRCPLLPFSPLTGCQGMTNGRRLHEKKTFFVTRFRGWDREPELLESRNPLRSSRVKLHS